MIAVDLCVDCMAAAENGDVAPEWSGFLEEWSGALFSLCACGGEDVDDHWCEGHSAAAGSRCDGCGSGLGGSRFCVRAFWPAETARGPS